MKKYILTTLWIYIAIIITIVTYYVTRATDNKFIYWIVIGLMLIIAIFVDRWFQKKLTKWIKSIELKGRDKGISFVRNLLYDTDIKHAYVNDYPIFSGKEIIGNQSGLSKVVNHLDNTVKNTNVYE